MSLNDRHVRHDWAHETFGRLEAGNRQRTRRVVAMAAQLAAAPAGRVTDVYRDSAEREGTYRFLSNDRVSSTCLIDAMCASATHQCDGLGSVYVAVDPTTLTLKEVGCTRGVGGIGAWKQGSRGLHVISALAMDADGIPIGICAQRWWVRDKPSTRRRFASETEMRHHSDVVLEAAERFSREAPGCRPVFLMDRGFDCQAILEIVDAGHFGVIIRAQQNRRLIEPGAKGPQYLRERLEKADRRGRYRLSVPARGHRPARDAWMELRALRVTIRGTPEQKNAQSVTMNAVLAREVDGPKGDALSWMLLTTEPIDTFDQVITVVRGYERRWRIEEVHRAWKRGGGNIEDTQLRSREAIIKWATLHCAVATRAVRLTQLAKTEPDAPASIEFTQDEIDAAIALNRKRTKLKIGSVPSLGEMVRLVADAGGYTGKSSGGPPGATVIGRGLERVAIGAEMLAVMRAK